jgi:hypothetical protein
MSASSWSVSSARCTYYHNGSRDSRPDCVASNSATGPPPILRSLCDSTDLDTEHALSLWLTRLAAVWPKLLWLEKDEVYCPSLAPNLLERDTDKGNGNPPRTLQGLDARGLRQSCLTLSRQFEKHAQSVIETFLVVPLFPFLEGALPRFALSAKRLCDILVQPASRLGGPLNPHRRNVRSVSLEKPIALQYASACTFKQRCLPWHGITSVSGSLQISIQANRESLIRMKWFLAPLNPLH